MTIDVKVPNDEPIKSLTKATVKKTIAWGNITDYITQHIPRLSSDTPPPINYKYIMS